MDDAVTGITNWVLAQGYWVWALGIAGSFYATTRFFGGHLSQDSRTDLSLWLMGAVEDRWAR